ncbi:hypothetical protein [Roseateles sp. P5_E8]
MAFDPYLLKEEVLAEGKVAASLSITTAEPLMLAPAGSAVQAPDGYRLQWVPPDAHVTVNADMLRLAGVFVQTGCEFLVAARVVELEGEVTIDVIGRAGAAPDPAKPQVGQQADGGKDGYYTYNFLGADPCTRAEAGQPGQPGENGVAGNPGLPGGLIDIRCQQLHGDKLTLTACGGRGGDGQPGQIGQVGGDGGKGAPYWTGGVADEEMPTPGGAAGAGGLGGLGGPGGYGGSGGTIRVYCMGALPTTLTTACLAGASGTTPDPADAGGAGEPGAGGVGAVVRRRGAPFAIPDAPSGGIGAPSPRRSMAQPDRTKPSAGQASLVAGAAAAPLSASAIALSIANDPLKSALHGTLRQTLFELTLERARIDTLRLDRSVQATVDDLLARLDFLITVGSAATGPQGKAPDPDAVGIAQAARGLRDTVTRIDIDAFGHPPTWVPLASLKVYDNLLGGSDGSPGDLERLKQAEEDWAQYQAAAIDDDARGARLQSAMKTAGAQLAPLKQQAQDARDKLDKLQRELARLGEDLRKAKSAVLLKAAQFKARIGSTFTIDFTKFIDVVEQMAFAAANPVHAGVVGASELGKMVTTGATQLTGADGESYREAYVVHRVEQYSARLKTLDEAYDLVKGYIQLKDPDGCKLLVQQQDMDELLDNFKTVAGADEAKDAMAAYVKQVLARNAQVLVYNDTLTQLDQLSGEIAQVQRRVGQRGAQLAAVTPSLWGHMVHGVYQQARRDCIRSLYMASRAYRCWSLDDYDVFKDVLGCEGPTDVTYLTALNGRQMILKNNIAQLERMGSDLSPRTEPVVVEFAAGSGSDIVTAFQTDRGQDVLFNDKARFWEFDLEPPTSDSTDGDSPFNDMMNVRMVEVRCWLLGMTASDQTGHIKVHLIHRGNERIVPRDGKSAVHVDHDPVEKTFEYRRAADASTPGEVVARAEYWGEHPLGELPAHTPLGPFTTWRIAVRPQDFKDQKVDWDQLKTVRLEFFVRYVGMDTR